MNFFQKSLTFIRHHKIISIMIVLVAIGGGYFWYHSLASGAAKTSYVSAAVEKGSIVSSVSGSGQVASLNQIDLKSKVSANVVYVGVKNGQHIKAGALMVEFNTADAQKAVRNAQISLENAKLSLQKTQSASITIPLTQQQAKDNLVKEYDDGFTAVSNAFLDLPSVMSGLNDILFGNTLSGNSQNVSYYRDYINLYNSKGSQYADNAVTAYQKAKIDYDENFNDYKSISRSANNATIEAMINQTQATSRDVSDAVKSANNLVQFYVDTFTVQALKVNPASATQITSLNAYTGQMDTGLSGLLNVVSAIQSDKNAIINSDVELQSQNLSLQGANISITQAQNSLADAQATLADYFIYAPFDGIIATLPLKLHDSASSGTIAATLIANQSMTQIPFNEVDITKIKVGQKATLTFDAIDNLSIVGQVADIDTLGTVTQGVVNYNVKIVFDSSGSAVKLGMSVTASVVTNVKQDVLTVSNSAIKSAGGQKYVQVLVNGAPVQKNVETGASNDSETEIISGISEGDNVITQTITSTATKTTTSAASSIRIPGATGGGGGFRVGN